MQPPHFLLFLFLPLLLHVMWADPEEPEVYQYFLTSFFANISFAEMSVVASLRDVPLFAMDPADWTIHFHWPWARQATAEGDAEKLMSSYKIALRNTIRYVHDVAHRTKQTYPLVVQLHMGCVMYPNTTTWGFLDIGAGGTDLVAFDVDKQLWETQQSSQLAEHVSKDLNKEKSVRLFLEHLLSIVCQNHILILNRYGKATLERQEVPVATVFARTPSPHQLLLVCHVTAFYPWPISVAWLRDGQEVPPGPALNTSTVLPNADLTYQLRSILAVAPRDGHSYACRVRHRSLGTRSLLIPWESHSTAPTISITIAELLLVFTASAQGVWWWKSSCWPEHPSPALTSPITCPGEHTGTGLTQNLNTNLIGYGAT
ncbi:antigen-presenting glycoprotein CD1d-like [Pithys albifrons albifrons]|uniref:antigen-presenting glycoprotein CD1d-like n=1 Tax=Pithys albifrons albifrons TaxID=3385563 RepID=UPI003A5CBB89